MVSIVTSCTAQLSDKEGILIFLFLGGVKNEDMKLIDASRLNNIDDSILIETANLPKYSFWIYLSPVPPHKLFQIIYFQYLIFDI